MQFVHCRKLNLRLSEENSVEIASGKEKSEMVFINALMFRVFSCFFKEAKRAAAYFHPSTEPLLVNVCEKVRKRIAISSFFNVPSPSVLYCRS